MPVTRRLLSWLERRGDGWMSKHLERQIRLGLELQFAPRADDVFIASYPRSGATLVQMMLLQLTGSGELDFIHVASRSPVLELELVRNSARFLESLPAPRLLKTFRRRESLPRIGRFLYIARDLLDVAVSAYHHASLLAGHELELDEFLRRFPAGHVRLSCSWFDHLRSWWPHRADPDVLFLEYDDVVSDPARALRRIAGFCGFGLDEREVPRMLERCTIDRMKRQAAKFDPRLRRLSPRPVSFIRRGENGAGRRELPPEQRRLYAARLAAFARQLGCGPEEPLYRLLVAKDEALSEDRQGASLGP